MSSEMASDQSATRGGASGDPSPPTEETWAARRLGSGGLLVGLAILAGVLITLPIVSVVVFALSGAVDGDGWGLSSMAATVLPRYALNTALLGLYVGLGCAAIGVGAAWLTVAYDFPGRRVFEWALALPLAFPAYVLAYAYTDLLDHPGLVQSSLRAFFGWGPRDYWFPEVRSLGGAAAMLTLVLYPYVYLLARTAFLQQSSAALDVARTLGVGSWGVFWRVAAPMARPAIVTGVALALMETFADFGVVAHFNVQTLATGVYRAWFSFGDPAAAAQIATCLVMFAALALALERMQRRSARFQVARARLKPAPRAGLQGWRAAGAVALCFFPLAGGFLIPLVTLISMTIEDGHAFDARYVRLTFNSLTLAAIAAGAAVVLALIMAYAARLAPGRLVAASLMTASLGYAMPGGVVAVGLLIPVAAFDNALDAWARANLGVSTGLLLTGSIALVVFAYVVRFMSVALQTTEAALGKVTPSMDHAARALGAGPGATLRRVHLPMVSGGLMTAALIVFVDVMKELPATLMLRPFNFDTLAIQAYNLAADERLREASTPSLVIALVGVAPVILLSLRIARAANASTDARPAP